MDGRLTQAIPAHTQTGRQHQKKNNGVLRYIPGSFASEIRIERKTARYVLAHVSAACIARTRALDLTLRANVGQVGQVGQGKKTCIEVHNAGEWL